MSMHFEELDETTRKFMLIEFEQEEASGRPYRSAVLSSHGLSVFPGLMRQAIQSGTEETFHASLLNPAYWRATNARGAAVNIPHQANQLSITEFNTWYVRGLSKRLIEEGVAQCQIYRAASPKFTTRAECSCIEEQRFPTTIVYEGHRAKYWPRHNSGAFSIPAGPSCHHTIRRA